MNDDTSEKQRYFSLSVGPSSQRSVSLSSVSARMSSESGDKHTETKNQQTHVSFPSHIEQWFQSSRAASVATKEQEESRKERFFAYLQKRFPSRIVRRVLKCTVAYFLSTLFSLIHPVARAIGQAPYLCTMGMLFSHPGRSMGAQFDATIMAIAGVVLSVAYAIAGLSASTAYNTRHLDTYQQYPVGSAVNAIFLFCGIFAAQLLRQFYPKFYFFSLHFMIVQIFSQTLGAEYITVPFLLPLEFGAPLLIGCGVSLVVNLVIWPETAVDNLGRALKETISSSKKMLDMITEQFFLDPEAEMVPEETISGIAEQMRKGVVKVRTAYREAKYELSYAYIRPQQLKDVRKSIERLTRHLSALSISLRTERELFENTLSILRNQTQMEDESDTEERPSSDNGGHASSQHESVEEKGATSLKVQTTQKSRSEEDILRKSAMASAASSSAGHPRSRHTIMAPTTAATQDEEEDEDMEHHQRTTSSIRSFLNLPRLLSPKPKPPQKKRSWMRPKDQPVLLTYLESLRDPLINLSSDCADVLRCISRTLATEFDIEDDGAVSTWLSYFRHLLKLGHWRVSDEESVEEKKYRHLKICDCSDIIRESLKRFDVAERDRMQELYDHNRKAKSDKAVDLSMREELFLVFFFIFTLRQVAKELETMVQHINNLKTQSGKKRKRLYMPRITLKWLRKWAGWNNHQSTRDKGGYSHAALAQYLPDDDKQDGQNEIRLAQMQVGGDTLKRTLTLGESEEFGRESSISNTPDTNKKDDALRLRKTNSSRRKEHRERQQSLFDIAKDSPLVKLAEASMQEKNQDERRQEQPLQQQATAPLRKMPQFLHARYKVWSVLQFLKKYEFKFALKVAVAVSILCIPAFVPTSRGWFIHERVQWASVTVIAIMNPTSGGTLQASLWRIVGTVIGALVGWAALETGSGSAYVLGIFAVLLAIPFFYIHLGSTYNRVGVVVLVSYVVIALVKYANPSVGGTTAETVWRRTVLVIVGILVAMGLNSLIWPFIARHATRKSASAILRRLGEYYAFLVGTFLYHDIRYPPTEADIKQSLKMEDKIQASLNASSVLLDLTDHEPRLKGPFPKEFYRQILASSQAILDHMGSMRVALTEMPIAVKLEICNQEHYPYRRDMIASLMLHLHTVSSSLATKMPLPIYMPSTRAARNRLISHRREATRKGSHWVTFRNLSWYAMANSSEEIVEELEYLTKLVRHIVGETKYADRAKRIDAIIMGDTSHQRAA